MTAKINLKQYYRFKLQVKCDNFRSFMVAPFAKSREPTLQNDTHELYEFAYGRLIDDRLTTPFIQLA